MGYKKIKQVKNNDLVQAFHKNGCAGFSHYVL